MRYTETYSYAHAHHLPTFPEGHKCRRVHGHVNDVTITWEVDLPPGGYAFDHALLDKVATLVIGPLDHALVNDVHPSLADGLAESQLMYIVRGMLTTAQAIIPSAANARLIEVQLDEWSTGGSLRKVAHRKSWIGREHGEPHPFLCSGCPLSTAALAYHTTQILSAIGAQPDPEQRMALAARTKPFSDGSPEGWQGLDALLRESVEATLAGARLREALLAAVTAWHGARP
jgi:6-pyruvoyl-tetrahydropterin synthase